MLRSVATPVDRITDEMRAIWHDMIDTMEAMPGVGLAAPQIGVPMALAVVDASNERGQVIRMANPRVMHASDKTRRYTESSPCLPGVFAEIERPAEVCVAFLDEVGAAAERGFEGLWATSVQHQIDHLVGRMYFDNLSRMRRQMLLKRAGKARA